MSDEEDLREEQLPLEGAGQALARARGEAGLSIEQVAAETRIPLRHLKAIEAGDFSELPSRTYAIGFSRSFARAVGVDEAEIADMVRAELADGQSAHAGPAATFAPADPERVPGRGLAWFSAFAAILLIVGAFAFFRGYFAPGSGPAPLIGEDQVEDAGDTAAPIAAAPIAAGTAPAEKPPVAAGGQVVFTAKVDGLWVKFYDAAGKRLMEKQMALGERYVVPADADAPLIWTGQPESLDVTVGGTAIGRLSAVPEIVRDVPVTAEALIARSKAQAQIASENADAATGQTEAG